MKLLVDLFPCQTYSRFRGIGRYTLSLTREMAKLRCQNEMVAMADALYPESFEELRQEFLGLLPAGSFLPYYHNSLEQAPWLTYHPQAKIANTLIEQAYQTIVPDVVLTPSLFEGWGGGAHGKVAVPDKKCPAQKRALILYDIIPLIFHEQYLDPDPLLKKWYLERIDLLPSYDLLLAISESTRQDAINILGLAPEKIVNISGAASGHFRQLNLSNEQKLKALHSFGISRPFVLYIGGNDFRKNMDGALRIFSKLPKNIISSHQLVFNDVGDEAAFRDKARRLGLSDSDIVVFRRISEEELVLLYNLCKLFIFPSLYEGFGLPVLEAMSCGAPVLASNNSSLPEVVGTSDALFDVTDENAAAQAVQKVLTDDDFRVKLGQHGVEQAKQLTWEKSAIRTWQALEGMISHSNPALYGQNTVKSSGGGKLKIAYVSPFPPQKSGIAEYSAALLPHLSKYFDIDLFAQPGLKVSNGYLENKFSIFPWTNLRDCSDLYDAVIYHMGNSEFHIPMLELLQEIPGIVVNHDFYNSNLPFVKEVRTSEKGIFYKAMDESHGLRGVIDVVQSGVDSARWKWPVNWTILHEAQELVIHSEHQNELINMFYGYGWKPKTRIIKQIRESAEQVQISEKGTLKKELGLDPETFLFCSFGFMAPTKLNNPTIRAFSRLLADSNGNITLVFVGDLEGGDYGTQTLEIIQELNLGKKVRITGFVSKDIYEKYLACADAAIQLRTDSRGETSRAVLDCMAYGLPVIINSHGSSKDYPDDVVIKLPESPSLEVLAQAMRTLCVDNEYRVEKGQRAQRYIVEQHNPEKIAADYAQVVLNAMHNQERKVFSPLFDAVSEIGAADDMLGPLVKLAAKNKLLRCQPRILIDVTDLNNADTDSDEFDMAKSIITEFLQTEDLSLQVELVVLKDDQLFRFGRITERLCGLLPESLESEKQINLRPGDTLVMLSKALPTPNDATMIFNIIRQRGGKIVSVIEKDLTKFVDIRDIQSDIFLCASSQSANILDEIVKSGRAERDVKIFIPKDEKLWSWQRAASWLMDISDATYFIPYGTSVTKEDDEKISGKPSENNAKTSDIYDVENNINDMPFENIVDSQENHTDSIKSTVNFAGDSETQLPTQPGDDVRDTFLKSSACSQKMLESDVFQDWVEQMKGRKLWMHRKLWEWAYISQALHERGFLKPGMRGLGFAVGQEPLPALFASYGCEIVATDLDTARAGEQGWTETNQHAMELQDLNKANICPNELFEKNVSFRFVDMNHLPDDLEGFDFIWSSCSLEHLGSLEHGKQFIYNAMKCLKPGGIAIHTTEFNISSNDETITDGPDVIYRKIDLEEIARHLMQVGHDIELDFSLGDQPLDLQVDVIPYAQDVHLRLEIGGYVCTSYGLIIQKAKKVFKEKQISKQRSEHQDPEEETLPIT